MKAAIEKRTQELGDSVADGRSGEPAAEGCEGQGGAAARSRIVRIGEGGARQVAAEKRKIGDLAATVSARDERPGDGVKDAGQRLVTAAQAIVVNAQAAVEVESRLIVGQRVSQAPNDKQELVPPLAAIPAEAGNLAAALVDSGFFSEKAVGEVERAGAGPVVYAAVEKTGHHRSVADLEKKPEPEPPGADASLIEVMRHRLKTTAGKTLYKLRQQTVEPVFGIVKSVLGFRQFRLRGRAKVALEWTLVCLAYNLKRLHRLGAGLKLAVAN